MHQWDIHHQIPRWKQQLVIEPCLCKYCIVVYLSTCCHLSKYNYTRKNKIAKKHTMGLWWDAEPKDTKQPYTDIKECKQHALIVLTKKKANVLLQHISKHNQSGCTMLGRGLETRNCSESVGNTHGYYHHGKKQIVICCNKTKGYGELENVITHELVHAYDFCRFNSLWYCKTRACSEVRAYNIAGSCQPGTILEMFNNDRKECLRQHAIASTSSACTGATDDVDTVFELCELDHTPVEQKTRHANHIEFSPHNLAATDKRFA
jgi:hypothetical protein